MRIKDKINLEQEGLEKEGPITIVAFGDSVTHGALGFGEINYETVYWNLLRRKIVEVRNYIPVNVINAGIGGTTTKASIERIDKQVLTHLPDLVIVCFGLNDVNGELEEYLSSLKIIFERCSASGAEVIFMTPNMLNTYVHPNTAEVHKGYAAVTAEYQNSGKMDLYISSAVKLATEMNITVCDCYSEWKKLSETQDTTVLLSNYINHPTKEMHELFANMLFELIFKDGTDVTDKNTSTMYEG
ncbi:MAG: GDSL family lipase [Clostridia bacterium]|nr:GDSL family lipase [Clostridia bacterium]